MRKKYFTLILTALLPMYSITAYAQETLRAPESAKAEPVKRIMTSHTFYDPKGALPICRTFLKGFRAQKGIEYIEPIITVNNYDDPALEPYKNRCLELKLNERSACEPNVVGHLKKFSGDELRNEVRKYCSMYYGTASFKFYELDTNKTEDGKLSAVYFERVYGPENRPEMEKHYGNGGYSMFNLNKCEQLKGAATHDPYAYFWRHALENYNAIIRYKGKLYIFDLYEISFGKYRQQGNLHYILHVDDLREDGAHGLCSFSTVDRK